MRSVVYILFLFNLLVNLHSQVIFEQIFSFDNFEQYEGIRKIWIDDLNNNGEDEMYIFTSNFHPSNRNWKIYCLDLSGNLLWNFSQNSSFNNFTSYGQLFNYGSTTYLILGNSRNETIGFDKYYYCDILIYNWDEFTLIDSLSVYHTTYCSFSSSYYNLNLNHIILNDIGDSLLLFVGEEHTDGWAEYGDQVETVQDITKLILFEENTITLQETINFAGKNLLLYDNYESIISFGYYHNWNNITPYSETSQHLKTISIDLQPNISNILTIENGFLKFITRNDNHYSDFGPMVLVSENDIDYQYWCYSPDLSETLWISDQIGFIEDGYKLTNSTCVSTNLGENYVLLFGELENPQDNFQLEIRNRTTGTISLSHQTDINPEYILKSNDTLYFIMIANNPEEIYVYCLQDEIQVSSDNSQYINPVLRLSNYPNPFNPSTTIQFSIQNDNNVNLSIFNAKGQKIKTLANNDFTKGNHTIIWNGDDDSGNFVGSGVYYYKIEVSGKTEAVKKCLLLK